MTHSMYSRTKKNTSFCQQSTIQSFFSQNYLNFGKKKRKKNKNTKKEHGILYKRWYKCAKDIRQLAASRVIQCMPCTAFTFFGRSISGSAGTWPAIFIMIITLTKTSSQLGIQHHLCTVKSTSSTQTSLLVSKSSQNH